MLTSPPTPAVMVAMPGRSRSSSSRSFCATEPVPLTENDASNAWPYCAGVLVRWVRLAPNTAVPQRTATARTAPTRAELTGTAVRPRPRSRALRIPMRALGGAPDALRKATTRDDRTTGSSSRRETSREARTAGQTPSASTATTATAAPPIKSSASKSNPGVGSASLASPTGTKKESNAASSTPPAAPARATASVRAMVR